MARGLRTKSDTEDSDTEEKTEGAGEIFPICFVLSQSNFTCNDRKKWLGKLWHLAVKNPNSITHVSIPSHMSQ